MIKLLKNCSIAKISSTKLLCSFFLGYSDITLFVYRIRERFFIESRFAPLREWQNKSLLILTQIYFTETSMDYKSVISFWFEEIEPKQWWVKDTQFDQLIKDRFLAIHVAATKGEIYTWRKTIEGRLAEIIVLDQFSRNIYRDTSLAFAFDTVALVLAQEAVAQENSHALASEKKTFLYMPFMHSESRSMHTIAVELYSQKDLESNLDFELKHKEIIDRFGRYPHRNAILNRESTPEEIEFLKQPGSSF